MLASLGNGDEIESGGIDLRPREPLKVATWRVARNENGRQAMNWDTVKGDWKQFRGKVKEQWGKLTDDELNRIEGRRDQLTGVIQKRYGIAKDEAERQVKEFERACDERAPRAERPLK
jgi:uncharacterized protein YjbJ (UPF0337 family)